MKSKAMCQGCRNDFYNGNNDLGIKECLSYKSAQVVQRFRIGWWTTPNKPSDFVKVTTLKCHSAPGKYADFEKLPAHLTQLKHNKEIK